jgi:hypothetical protein
VKSRILAQSGRSWGLLREFLDPSKAGPRGVPTLDGALSPNDDLDGFEEVYASGSVEPDDVLVTTAGDLAVSSGNAVILPLVASPQDRILAEFPGQVGAITEGLHGDLLACVADHGLFRVRPGGHAPELVTESVEGHALSCLTAVVVGPEGDVFVAQGSRTAGIDEWSRDLLEKGRSGFVARIDPETGRGRIIADQLAWPFGVCVSPEGALVVSEAWAHRLLRIDLSSGATSIVIADLPGYPARIHASASGGYWLAFLSLRTHLVEFVLREDSFRTEMLQSVPSEAWIAPALRTTGLPTEPLQIGQMKHLSVTKPWAPPRSYGLVARLGADFSFERSYHSRAGGSRHGVLSARQHGDLLVVAVKGGRALVTTELGEGT